MCLKGTRGRDMHLWKLAAFTSLNSVTLMSSVQTQSSMPLSTVHCTGHCMEIKFVRDVKSSWQRSCSWIQCVPYGDEQGIPINV
jgi:hypothetical protein